MSSELPADRFGPEYYYEYREKHREELNKYQREYHRKNTEKIKEIDRKRYLKAGTYDCPCGSLNLARRGKAAHERTAKHRRWSDLNPPAISQNIHLKDSFPQ